MRHQSVKTQSRTLKKDDKSLKTSKVGIIKKFKLLKRQLNRTILIYFLLAILRVTLTCLPQPGYVHPDEFFQSIEIMAGDVFDVDYKRPWEFNHTEPVRSAIIPFFTVGIPYRFLRLFDELSLYYFDFSINIPYFLLVFPRFFVCSLSFLVDYSLYKICKINHERSSEKLLFLGSSYVMFVYGTRTFSNTIEMVLLSVLLFLVAESQVHSKNVIAQDEYLTDRYNKSKVTVDRVRFYKLKMLLPSHSLRHCVAISVITVTGVFNRPTFMAFAICPIFFWFHRGLGSKSVRFAHFHWRMLLFLLCAAVTVLFYIIIDSFYFGHLSLVEVLTMDISMNNFVVTPLNFIRYNMKVDNLAQHGLHPRTLHLLVNIPLLYNVLGIVTVGNLVLMFYRLLRGKYTLLPHIYSTWGLMAASIIAPIAALSYFPHQEPRFLIPITLPIVFLYSNIIVRKPYIYKMWIFLNVVCLIFYGFIHQAGLYPASVRMSKEVRLSQQTAKPIYLITSHVYNLPISLLQHQNTQRIYGYGSSKYMKSRTLFLQELGSSSLPILTSHVNAVVHKSSELKRKANVLLLVPTSKFYSVNKLMIENNLTMTAVNMFYPHISTEALPDFHHSLSIFYEEHSVSNFVVDLFYSCGLGLYLIRKES